MADDVAIKVDQVSKIFKLPHEKQTSIKNALINFYKKRSYERQEVLNDVSFEIKKGQFFGIVGRNGSGKSTLLKLLAGIYVPTKGSVSVHGRLTPFIELGVGFNPELTGRENVFLNGALLGFTRSEMLAMYDDIVAFAEIERFMDQKLKNYSSGMQVRLAFSIAIRAKSDILLIDEVLAVGDAAFQQKCFDIFEQFKKERRTIVFVSHDMENVRRFCDRALFLSSGKIIRIGEPRDIAYDYDKQNREELERQVQKENEEHTADASFQIALTDESGESKLSFEHGDTMAVSFRWPAGLKVKNVGVSIFRASGENVFGTNTMADDVTLPGTDQATMQVKLNLGPGKYIIAAGLFGKTRKDVLAFQPTGPEFFVVPRRADSEQKEHWEGITELERKWS